MTTSNYRRLGRYTALFSFLFGIAIFFAFFLVGGINWILLGYGFIVLAGLFNIAVLLGLSMKARQDQPNKRRLYKTARLLLLNIPVSFCYVYFVLLLFGTMRITFINDTSDTLTNIEIVGCGAGFIDQLQAGEQKTVWVPINGDCSLSLVYQQKGQSKSEVISGYVTRLTARVTKLFGRNGGY